MDDDLVFEVPAREMFEASGLTPPPGLLPNGFRRNDAGASREKLQAAEAFAATGVRVALVRSDSWTPKSRAPKLGTLREAALFLRHLADYDQEHFVVVCLDSEGRVLAVHEAAVGGLSQAAVEGRQAIKVALLTNAASVWVCHNHPSGDPQPSAEDYKMTATCADLLRCAGIEFRGHLIVAAEGYRSVPDPEAAELGMGQGGAW